jgi:hypothetical protein
VPSREDVPAGLAQLAWWQIEAGVIHG